MRRLLRSLDDFGHPTNLTYKGEETYQSCLGGIITLVVSAFTIGMAVVKMQSVVDMSDPIITSFPRPLTYTMQDEIGTVSF